MLNISTVKTAGRQPARLDRHSGRTHVRLRSACGVWSLVESEFELRVSRERRQDDELQRLSCRTAQVPQGRLP
jgi:hypothetical protein